LISDTELDALIYLLDDNDQEVLRHVESKLLSEGASIIPALELKWEEEQNPVICQKLESLIQEIQDQTLLEAFRSWQDSGSEDLLEGALLISRIQYPGLDPGEVEIQLEKLRLSAWLELHYDLSPLEKVNILNHVFYQLNGFKGNTQDYHAPDNSFIHRVLENKTGNPITLACIYAIIAQRLNMPVFGVNLPQHFVLVYMDESDLINPEGFDQKSNLNYADFQRVLFYINPFTQGQIFGKKNVDDFLSELKLAPRAEYYIPCSPLEMVRRMLRNLYYAYSRQGKTARLAFVSSAMKVLGMDDEAENGEDSENDRNKL
jgi:regulator of sirC expression with transglutaminase-like and TPR domain